MAPISGPNSDPNGFCGIRTETAGLRESDHIGITCDAQWLFVQWLLAESDAEFTRVPAPKMVETNGRCLN